MIYLYLLKIFFGTQLSKWSFWKPSVCMILKPSAKTGFALFIEDDRFRSLALYRIARHNIPGFARLLTYTSQDNMLSLYLDVCLFVSVVVIDGVSLNPASVLPLRFRCFLSHSVVNLHSVVYHF